MIVVKIEIWPYGDKSKAQHLGKVEIAHIPGSLKSYEGHDEADYMVNAFDANDMCIGHPAKVRGHRRQRGFWPLVRHALAMLYPR